MLVRMLIGTGGPNGTACFVGEVYDLPDTLARQWVQGGRAVLVDAPTVDGGVTPIHGDPTVMSGPPPVRKRR